jgi:very-short-patch-repair endonuclease
MRPARLQELLADAPGAWSREQLIERFGREALQRAIRYGNANRILPAIYCGAPWTHHFETRAQGASLWCAPTGMVGGLAAARVHELLASTPGHVSLALPRQAHVVAPPWIRVRRYALAMRVEQVRGLCVVPVADALIQSWEELPPGRGIGIVLDAVRSKRTTADALTNRLAEYPRVRGRRELAKLLVDMSQGIDSYLEYVATTRVFNTEGFHDFERHVRVRAMGRGYVLDMMHRRTRVAVEFDGRKFHSDDDARRRDLERDANLAAEGIVTLRFTYEDIMNRPQWCRERVRRTVKSRLP